MIELRLSSVGNPDFGQYAPVSEPKTVRVPDLKGAVDACWAYIQENALGGGNFVDPKVIENGVHIGYISYNGRFWTVEEWSDRRAVGRRVH